MLIQSGILTLYLSPFPIQSSNDESEGQPAPVPETNRSPSPILVQPPIASEEQQNDRYEHSF